MISPNSKEKQSSRKWYNLFQSWSKSKIPPAMTRANNYVSPGRGLREGQNSEGKVFGVALQVSLKYASVAISMIGKDSQPQIFGYVPLIVAKCGMMLKETATETEGIFRVSGANKRINQLQEIFDNPPRYGKDLDWTGYSVHDAASVLRRFLNAMPEPVIPELLFRDFVTVLQTSPTLTDSIASYRNLIALLPPTSRYLLLYLLDFLSVFARSAKYNLMTSSNLAVVFQPGLVSTRSNNVETGTGLLGFPGFDESGRIGEAGKGKQVLEFLIDYQSFFVFGGEEEEGGNDSNNDLNYASGIQSADKGKEREKVVPKEISKGLERRGSEKSDRRRLRKSLDGRVKRSKTLPTGKKVDPNSSVESTPSLSVDSKSKRNSGLTNSEGHSSNWAFRRSNSKGGRRSTAGAIEDS